MDFVPLILKELCWGSFLHFEGRRGPKHKEFGGSRDPGGGGLGRTFLVKFSTFMPFFRA